MLVGGCDLAFSWQLGYGIAPTGTAYARAAWGTNALVAGNKVAVPVMYDWALPYWDWGNPTQRQLPQASRVVGSALLDASRNGRFHS